MSDIVKLSDEDAHWLYPGRCIDEVAAHVLSLGVLVVAVTRGSAGAEVFSGDMRLAQPAACDEIVDTVGAGDAFMVGLIQSILELSDGQTAEGFRRGGAFDLAKVETMAQLGQRFSGIVVGRAGADLPWAAEVA